MTTRRLLISDATVGRLPYATAPRGYIASDRKLGGFHVRVGLSTKTYRLQMDVRENGRRVTKSFALGKHPYIKADAARAKALDIVRRRAREEPLAGPTDRGGMSFSEAWQSYQTLLKKKKRSTGTIADYKDKHDRHLKRFHLTPLRSITRANVVALHGEVTANAGPYAANGTMRVGHAIFNHAAKDLEVPGLPTLNPFRGRNLLNEETPRDCGMGTRELPRWWSQLRALSNPIMQELHLITLLTGLRRSEVASIRWENIDLRNRCIVIPSPKGGLARAFKAPLTRPMLRALWRARRAGRTMCEQQSKVWCFPSDRSASGHIEEPKGRSQQRQADKSIQRVTRIEKTGHALRLTFRTLAGVSGMSRTFSRILMNHKIDGDVHDEYMSVPAMFEQLHTAQEKLSGFIIEHAVPNTAGRRGLA
jgi:integrase